MMQRPGNPDEFMTFPAECKWTEEERPLVQEPADTSELTRSQQNAIYEGCITALKTAYQEKIVPKWEEAGKKVHDAFRAVLWNLLGRPDSVFTKFLAGWIGCMPFALQDEFSNLLITRHCVDEQRLMEPDKYATYLEDVLDTAFRALRHHKTTLTEVRLAAINAAVEMFGAHPESLVTCEKLARSSVKAFADVALAECARVLVSLRPARVTRILNHARQKLHQEETGEYRVEPVRFPEYAKHPVYERYLALRQQQWRRECFDAVMCEETHAKKITRLIDAYTGCSLERDDVVQIDRPHPMILSPMVFCVPTCVRPHVVRVLLQTLLIEVQVGVRPDGDQPRNYMAAF